MIVIKVATTVKPTICTTIIVIVIIIIPEIKKVKIRRGWYRQQTKN
jgi:hypothetical protein